MDSFGTTALKLLQKRRPVVKTKVTLRITKAKRLPGSTVPGSCSSKVRGCWYDFVPTLQKLCWLKTHHGRHAT